MTRDPTIDDALPVEFIPRERELTVGMQLIRRELCEKCGDHTQHTFTLRSNTPRYWVYYCHQCSEWLRS